MNSDTNVTYLLHAFETLPPSWKIRLSCLVHPSGSMRHWIYLLPRHTTNDLIASLALDGLNPVAWAAAFHHFDSPPSVYNLGVFVDPEYRRRGIGAKILQRLVEEALPGKTFSYSAGYQHAPNVPGLALYASYANRPNFHRTHY